MKIRAGFVSNSSSSSFLIMATEKVFEKAFEELHDLEKLVVNDFLFTGEVGTTKVKGISYGIDLQGDTTDYIIEDLVENYRKNHPNDDYSKFDTMNDDEEDEWAPDPYGVDILDRFGNRLGELAKEANEEVFDHSEGRG